jgi:predicted CopG family antitoxin
MRGRRQTHRRHKDPHVGVMRITLELNQWLFAEKGPYESFSDCCLRLLKSKSKEIVRLTQELEQIRQMVPELKGSLK